MKAKQLMKLIFKNLSTDYCAEVVLHVVDKEVYGLSNDNQRSGHMFFQIF